MGDGIVDPSIGGFIQSVKSYRDRTVLDALVVTTGWIALDTDTENIAQSDKSILGDKSLDFDKANTAANKLVAGVEKTFVNAIDLSEFLASDLLTSAFFAPALTNMISISIRLGTDSSNYSVWTILVAALTANEWNPISLALSAADVGNQVGTGHDLSVIAYAALIVTFTAETNALENLTFDHLHVQAANN